MLRPAFIALGLALPLAAFAQNSPPTAGEGRGWMARGLLDATLHDSAGGVIGQVQDLILIDPTARRAPPPEGAAGIAPEVIGQPKTTGPGEAALARPQIATPPVAEADRRAAEQRRSETAPLARNFGTDDTVPPGLPQLSHVVVDIGGFLGLGAHRVAVPFSDITVIDESGAIRLATDLNRATLEGLPLWQPQSGRDPRLAD